MPVGGIYGIWIDTLLFWGLLFKPNSSFCRMSVLIYSLLDVCVCVSCAAEALQVPAHMSECGEGRWRSGEIWEGGWRTVQQVTFDPRQRHSPAGVEPLRGLIKLKPLLCWCLLLCTDTPLSSSKEERQRFVICSIFPREQPKDGRDAVAAYIIFSQHME